jgi:hypothetical protein
MKIPHGRFDSLDIILVKPATDIQVKCGQGRAMVNNTHSADDDELKAAVFESGEQGCVILSHGND